MILTAIRPQDVYRGKWKFKNPIYIILSVLLFLIFAAIFLFFALQRYIVVDSTGLRLEIPFLMRATEPPPDEDIGGNLVLPSEIIIDAADFDDIRPIDWGEMQEVRALYVPSEDLDPEVIANYTARFESLNANALLLDMKPDSGQLSYFSGSLTAASFGTNNTRDMTDTISSLKENGVYLVARVSCFVDNLMSQRNAPLALKDVDGAPYRDENGSYWLDPGNKGVSDYIAELCRELFEMGFDEILLANLKYPSTSGAYFPSQELTATPDNLASISGVSQRLTNAFKDAGKILSVLCDAEAFKNSTDEVTGQNSAVFFKVFGRLYCSSSAGSLGADRDLAGQAVTADEIDTRFVPVMQSGADEGSFVLR